jgi:hypothetical protein
MLADGQWRWNDDALMGHSTDCGGSAAVAGYSFDL